MSLDDELEAALASQDEVEARLVRVLAEREELRSAARAFFETVKVAGAALMKDVGPLAIQVAARLLVDAAARGR